MANKRPLKCPECGSTKLWRKGKTPNKSGPKIRMVCTECASTFYLSAIVKNKKTGKTRK